MFPPPLLLLVLHLILLLCCPQGSRSSEAELQILLDFASSLNSTDARSGFASWSPASSSPCEFSGVLCDGAGSVTEIDISGWGVGGSIPFGSLCSLRGLSMLDAGNNNLTGEISPDVRNCTSLEHLDLAFNKLSGEVPDLSTLAALKFLNLSDNELTGQFPWASLGELTGLEVLNVGDNSFGPSVFPEVVAGLRRLTVLCLYDSNLYGEIPRSIGNLTALVDLELSDNNLTGVIPPEIAKLSELWQLELYNNSLTGGFPQGFGNLTKLAFFDASMNNLQGNLSELRTMTNLVSLQLFYNFFSGEIPQEFGEFQDLVNLSLYSNQLTGILPANLGSSSEFNFIDVSTNSLTGTIPPDMCRRGTMKKLLVLENRLSGEIPASYANCTTLTRFRVSNNSISGKIPAGIWSLPNVNIIDLAMNQFEGSIGAGISGAKSLYQLLLANNRFSGYLPPEIAEASSLVQIDASFNQFSGSIPSSIGGLKTLTSLDLKNNMFSGEIPSLIGACVSLNTMDLSNNQISGQIPASLGDLPSLNSLDLSRNLLTGQIPSSLSSLKLSSLNLSDNRLSGAVPAAFAIAAFNNSFAGNPALCGDGDLRLLRQCAASDSGGNTSERIRTHLACIFAGFALLLASLVVFLFVRRKKMNRSHGGDRSSRGSWDTKSFRVLTFDEQEILDSIRQENLIGKGGSGNVYRVYLGTGKVVAVKLIWNDADPEACHDSRAIETAMLSRHRRRPAEKSHRQFEAEVGALSTVRHMNVVKLYCSITCEQWSLLVYEHLPNGSLWDRLHTCHGGKLGVLQWETRLDVAVGAARGLEYLHHGHDRPVLHRDVKSSNILLDEDFRPRIADFGLSKILHSDGKYCSSTHVIAGTHGYIAPEYAYTWKVDEKSDVYSFGVVLLELVTGRRPIEPEYGDGKDIVDWVGRHLGTKEGVMGLLDTAAIKQAWEEEEEAVRMLQLAVRCTAKVPATRPTMRAVVQMLEKIASGRTTAAGGFLNSKSETRKFSVSLGAA